MSSIVALVSGVVIRVAVFLLAGKVEVEILVEEVVIMPIIMVVGRPEARLGSRPVQFSSVFAIVGGIVVGFGSWLVVRVVIMGGIVEAIAGGIVVGFGSWLVVWIGSWLVVEVGIMGVLVEEVVIMTQIGVVIFPVEGVLII